VKNTCIWF